MDPTGEKSLEAHFAFRHKQHRGRRCANTAQTLGRKKPWRGLSKSGETSRSPSLNWDHLGCYSNSARWLCTVWEFAFSDGTNKIKNQMARWQNTVGFFACLFAFWWNIVASWPERRSNAGLSVLQNKQPPCTAAVVMPCPIFSQLHTSSPLPRLLSSPLLSPLPFCTGGIFFTPISLLWSFSSAAAIRSSSAWRGGLGIWGTERQGNIHLPHPTPSSTPA